MRKQGAKIVKLTTVNADFLRIPNYNPQIHDEPNIAQIKRSIKELGFADPIIARTDGLIVAGVGRFMALKELWAEGWKAIPPTAIPVVLIECDDQTAKKLTVALNRIQSDTDFFTLSALLHDLLSHEPDADLTVMGLNEMEIAELLSAPAPEIETLPAEPSPVDLKPPPFRKKPITDQQTVRRQFDLPIELAPIVDTAIAKLTEKLGRNMKSVGLTLVVMAKLTECVDEKTLNAVIDEVASLISDDG